MDINQNTYSRLPQIHSAISTQKARSRERTRHAARRKMKEFIKTEVHWFMKNDSRTDRQWNSKQQGQISDIYTNILIFRQ